MNQFSEYLINGDAVLTDILCHIGIGQAPGQLNLLVAAVERLMQTEFFPYEPFTNDTTVASLHDFSLYGGNYAYPPEREFMQIPVHDYGVNQDWFHFNTISDDIFFVNKKGFFFAYMLEKALNKEMKKK